MRKYSHRKSFIFHNKAEGLASVVRNCAKYIEKQNELLGVSVSIHSKVKWAITELLINGAKHSGSERSRLNLKFSENDLTIEKEDFGKPLKLTVMEGQEELQWPLSQRNLNQYFEVYRNGMDCLCVFTENETMASFIIKEVAEEDIPSLLVNTSEHFGLMIIAKASSEFAYYYESKKGKNIFTVRFDYQA